MRRLILCCLMFVSSCTSCDGGPRVIPVDSLPVDAPPICNPLTQAGCAGGEKCTWLVDALMPQYVGHLGCAPDGAIDVGGSCMYGAPGTSGYDNCAKGGVCSNYGSSTAGVCKQVCDPSGGNPMCGNTHVCVTYAGLFSTPDSMGASAGVCDLACDPIADNDFDGSGGAAKVGTTCGSDATTGCYGYPSFGTAPKTGWSCGDDVNATEAQPTGFRHRVQCTVANNCADPGPTIYVNSCNQGYLPLLYEMTGSTTVVCIAMCKPMNCFEGNCGTNNDNRLGMAPHRCNPVDRGGSFDTAQGAEHCQYLWRREVDQQGAFLRSATSDTVGFCFDHSKYLYDSDNDNTPDLPLPACATLPDGEGTADTFGAADLGCVDTTHVPNLVHGKLRLRPNPLDDMRPPHAGLLEW